jgi:hypothetical protein
VDKVDDIAQDALRTRFGREVGVEAVHHLVEIALERVGVDATPPPSTC